MTIGSLFSGIGGLELGLERAGLGPTVWQVETDPFCRQVLEKHWPDADRSVCDVREANAGTLPWVDIICGGFPCQDISYAGKGAGLDGERSGLWFEYLRIVRDLRPQFVVVENVAALLTRGLDVVLGSLAESGYDTVWTSLRASDVGAPHRRERVFVVAYRVGDGPQDNEQARPTPRAVGGCDVVADPARRGWARTKRAGWRDAAGTSGGKTQPRMGGATHGLPGRLDGRWPAGQHEAQNQWEAPRTTEGCQNRAARLKSLGNAVVPQCAEVVGWVIGGLA